MSLDVTGERAGTENAVVFTLKELLVDLATGDAAAPPAWESDWESQDDWNPPPSSASALLGTAVPHCAVLTLAGALSASATGMDAELRAEAVGPDRVLIAYQKRRFGLGLAGGDCAELCRQQGCEDRILDVKVPWCPAHLSALDLSSLVGAATAWAWTCHAPGEPETSSPGWPAEELMKAAVAAAAGEMVAEAIVTAAFDDPDEMEQRDVPAEYEDILRTRHAMDRERLRLWGMGRQEAQRLREAADGCVACHRALSWLDDGFAAGAYPGFRPRYCSATCDPLPPARERYREAEENRSAPRYESFPF
ncbi:hypothetical protein [Kitasatospora sp. NPDC098663]|uniref:hypothetical protein n=1 Tax=Kitasatospora sp. NPDC098663 TaxID=3364096 RepID=UPI0038072AB5